MTDDTLRERREANLVSNRIGELHETPIQGNFDTAHLKATHAYLFQDLPHHRPGIIRADTNASWIKHRVLEGQTTGYDVPYAHRDIERRLDTILSAFGGPGTLRGLTRDAAAKRMAELYGDLDHAHAF